MVWKPSKLGQTYGWKPSKLGACKELRTGVLLYNVDMNTFTMPHWTLPFFSQNVESISAYVLSEFQEFIVYEPNHGTWLLDLPTKKWQQLTET